MFKQIKILSFLFILFWCQTAFAFTTNDLPELEPLFDGPCLKFDIPKPVAMAIAKVESGLKPWVLNIDGRGYRFASKEDALAKAEEAWEAGLSFDVGLMQINRWWLMRYNISLEAALDPLANIYFGSWILKEELARHGGDMKAAIGAYHSPTPAKANNYAQVVLNALAKGPIAVPKPSQKKALFAVSDVTVSNSKKETEKT